MKDMTPEEFESFLDSIKNIVENQNKQRDTLKKLVLMIADKIKQPKTVHDQDKLHEQALYKAGLGHKPFGGRF